MYIQKPIFDLSKTKNMAYLSTARIAEIRKELKAAFPALKFSITSSNGSGVQIDILEGNINFGSSYKQTNVYYLDRSYTGAALETLLKIKEVASAGTKYYETGDYGTQPSHYVYIHIGQWDRPYKFTVSNEKGKTIAAFKLKSLKTAAC